MPVPTTFADISVTAASNSPNDSDNVFPDNDNYLRAAFALIKSVEAGSGNGYTNPYLLLTGGTLSGGISGTSGSFSSTITASSLTPTGAAVPSNGMYLSAANTLALASNSTLRWSVNSTGNHVIPAPSSGVALAVSGVSGQNAVTTTSAGSTGASFASTSAAGVSVSINTVNSAQAWQMGLGPGTGTNVWNLFDGTRSAVVMTASTSGNVTISAPSSGVAETVNGIAGADAWAVNGGTSGAFRVNTTGVPYGTALHNNAGAVTGTTNQYLASGTYTPTANATLGNVSTATANLCQWIRVGNVVTVSGSVAVDPVSASTRTIVGIPLPIASNFSAQSNCSGSVGFEDASNVYSTGFCLADATNDIALLSCKNTTDTASNNWYFSFTYLIL